MKLVFYFFIILAILLIAFLISYEHGSEIYNGIEETIKEFFKK